MTISNDPKFLIQQDGNEMLYKHVGNNVELNGSYSHSPGCNTTRPSLVIIHS